MRKTGDAPGFLAKVHEETSVPVWGMSCKLDMLSAFDGHGGVLLLKM
jgi:hypothetical protein